MGRRLSARNTEEKLAKRINAGFGQGTGRDYKSFIGIRDISSIGTSTRLWSWKLGRTLQFLSNIERDAFLVAEFKSNFVDYWEQFPLERYQTQDAANTLGYRHPVFFGTRVPTVMTLDGVLTVSTASGQRRSAVECKHSSSLEQARTLEKLAITRLVCNRLRLPHILVTERSLPRVELNNILWVRMSLPKNGEIAPVSGAFDLYPSLMHADLLRKHSVGDGLTSSISQYCAFFDAEHALPVGLGLRCMKQLMWTHRVTFDIQAPRPADIAVGALGVAPVESQHRESGNAVK